jgi:HD-like signal output (HDOD) protein
MPQYVKPLPGACCAIGTRLQLDLLLRQRSIDVAAVAETILADPGATLQILRLIGEEFPQPEERPVRMEDCIAILNHEHWYAAVCTCMIPLHSSLTQEWERRREVARCAKALAHSLEGFSPDEAYMVGLFHNLGHMPRLLGWQLDARWPSDEDALGIMLAEHWNLPGYLISALREQHNNSTTSRWGVLIHFARSVAEKSLSSKTLQD